MTVLPAGWRWSTLGQVADVVGGVTKDSKRDGRPDLVEVPYLRVANVQRGRIDLTQVLTICVPAQTAAKLELKRGDVLFNEGGDRDLTFQVLTCHHSFGAQPPLENRHDYAVER